MAISPIPTQITCPNCRHVYTAPVEQIFDVGQDPEAKLRILRGRFNHFACPNCRFPTRVNGPILYHDPEKSLLLTYMPMELGMRSDEQERLIGRLVQQVIQTLPAEKRRGYLFTPQSVLTLQGLVDRILEADGITAEMREAQRARADLLQQMLAADESGLAELAAQHDTELDYDFFDMLAASAEGAAADGDAAGAQRLLELRARLLPLTSIGKQSQAQAQILDDTARELEQLGDDLTLDKFLDLVIQAPSEDRLAALIALARPLADYTFFQKLSDRMDKAKGPEKERLRELRETILRLTQEIDAAAQARVQQTAAVIRQMLSAPDPRPVIRQYLPAIDESFLAVLSANAEAALRSGRKDIADRLQQLTQLILTVLNESAPPELQFINQLMSAESEEAAQAMLRNRAAEVTPEVLEAMTAVADAMRQNGQTAAADRLTQLRSLAEREAAAARWRA
jgi:hypothetical protein